MNFAQRALGVSDRDPHQCDRDRDRHLSRSQRHVRQSALCAGGRSEPRLRQRRPQAICCVSTRRPAAAWCSPRALPKSSPNAARRSPWSAPARREARCWPIRAHRRASASWSMPIWEPGKRVAFPDAANEAILRRFRRRRRRAATSIPISNRSPGRSACCATTCCPNSSPTSWSTGSPSPTTSSTRSAPARREARAAIRNDDREVGLLLDRLRELGLAEKTNIIVVSDHGFGHGVFGVDVTGELIKAGLKAGPDSDDVVVASSGQTISLHVRDRNRRTDCRHRALPAAAALGRRACSPPPRQPASGVPTKGREPGTFALELVHMANAERGPDIVFTFPWSSARSPFGVPGTDYTDARATGPLTGTAGNHGSMSPWVVHNTFIAWGPDFKRGVTVRTPASNVDLAPTLLALMNLDKGVTGSLRRARAARGVRRRSRRGAGADRGAHLFRRDAWTAATAPRCRSPSSRTSATSTRAGGCGEPRAVLRVAEIMHSAPSIRCIGVAGVYFGDSIRPAIVSLPRIVVILVDNDCRIFLEARRGGQTTLVKRNAAIYSGLTASCEEGRSSGQY